MKGLYHPGYERKCDLANSRRDLEDLEESLLRKSCGLRKLDVLLKISCGLSVVDPRHETP